MRDTIDPDFEFDWGPTLWAAAVVVFFGLLGNFVLARPQLLGHGAVLAGVAASFRSSYYQNSGYNAAIGTFLGVLLVTPALVYARVVFVFGIEGAGDTLFISTGVALAWLLVAIIILLPLAYIGSVIGDFTRKKVGGPLGY